MSKTSIILAIVMLGLGLVIASFGIAIKPVAAHECPEQGCVTEGRMTGGGRLNTDMVVTHGFELHCDVSDVPNNLEVNWDGGNHFHLSALTDVICIDEAGISPNPPAADFDLLEAHGTGTYNGEDGARIYFVFTDAGEPGKDDTARIKIVDADNNVVLDVGTTHLNNGNHQAH
jgi:hypothetical protein